MLESDARMNPICIPEGLLRELICLDTELITLMRNVYVEISLGGHITPPIFQLIIPPAAGQLCVKGAYRLGSSMLAIKVSGNFPAAQQPVSSGLMMVFDTASGALRALLLDNGYLTQIRTAAAGAAATNALAVSPTTYLGVLGAGRQARLQVEALSLIRPIHRVRLWARSPGKAHALASHLGRALGIDTAVSSTVEETVRESNVLITTTSSAEPLVRAAWLHPGLHITAIGSDSPGKCELEPAVLAAASVYSCDRREQCATHGEWRAARASGVLVQAAPPEIGEIIAGTRQGRTNPDEITIADLTGVGLQDTAIAVTASSRFLNRSEPRTETMR